MGAEVEFGGDLLSVPEMVALAHGYARPVLSTKPEALARFEKGARVVRDRIAAGDSLYGVTTGFGDSVVTDVPGAAVGDLPLHLMRYHGCGTGPLLSPVESAAVLAVRTASLSRGFSGVRPQLLAQLLRLLERRVLPCIPAEGSVGASGDLTPLSYVAALVVGEREAWWEDERVAAAQALASAGMEPLTLAPKESLAIMNGTSVMTALGCLAWERGRTLARWACRLSAAAVHAADGNPSHFDARIGALKPHPGQMQANDWIREALGGADKGGARLQDRYSLRCAPHVIGVLLDALATTRRVLDVELNSVNDNPIVDPEAEEFLNGGNFYGGHIAWALDGLKTAVANVVALMDRQLVLLCSPYFNGGLPANLVARDRADSAAHHGFKAMQISTSSLAAEALKRSMPASVFSRSTECHNQDIVSMGTHSARDCAAVLELAESAAAIHALGVCQAMEIRGGVEQRPELQALLSQVRELVSAVDEDRRQDQDIERIREWMRTRPDGELA